MMNYNWHKKFQKKSKVNHNELYLLGLAEQNKRKKELENQKKVKKNLKNNVITTRSKVRGRRKEERTRKRICHISKGLYRQVSSSKSS